MDLALRPLEVHDLPRLAAWFDDDETHRWLGGPEWLERVVAATPDVRGTFRGALVLDSVALLATIGPGPVALLVADVYDRSPSIVDAPRHAPEPLVRTGGIAILVDPTMRRQGVGTAALRALVSHRPLGAVRRWRASVEPGNAASRGVFAAAGFRTDDAVDTEGLITSVLDRD